MKMDRDYVFEYSREHVEDAPDSKAVVEVPLVEELARWKSYKEHKEELGRCVQHDNTAWPSMKRT